MWESFLKSFIPLFFALDALGVLPLYARFSIKLDKAKRHRVLRDSIITAFLVTLAFIIFGNKVLLYLNISIYDFLIAGGVILFIISTRDLVGGGRDDLAGQEDLFAVVPLGVPLLAGPGGAHDIPHHIQFFRLFLCSRLPAAQPAYCGNDLQIFTHYSPVCQPQVGRGDIEGICPAPREYCDHVHPDGPSGLAPAAIKGRISSASHFSAAFRSCATGTGGSDVREPDSPARGPCKISFGGYILCIRIKFWRGGAPWLNWK